jgi:hypothetical protein
MRERLGTAVRYWIPIAIAVTAMSVLIYVAVQQDFRKSLNDPQLQMAQDVANRLLDGAPPKSFAATPGVDIAASLSPWVVVCDINGKPVASGASLEGTTPVPPKGVFEYTLQNGEDRITWQPRSDVRVATVIEYWRGKNGAGFVVTGRNMREVEDRIGALENQVAALWLLTMAATLGATFALVPVASVPPAERSEDDGEA